MDGSQETSSRSRSGVGQLSLARAREPIFGLRQWPVGLGAEYWVWVVAIGRGEMGPGVNAAGGWNWPDLGAGEGVVIPRFWGTRMVSGSTRTGNPGAEVGLRARVHF